MSDIEYVIREAKDIMCGTVQFNSGNLVGIKTFSIVGTTGSWRLD